MIPLSTRGKWVWIFIFLTVISPDYLMFWEYVYFFFLIEMNSFFK